MKFVKGKSVIADQAVIVITVQRDGVMTISSQNNGRSKAAKMADAICNMVFAVIENPPTFADSPTDAPSGGAR